MTHVVSDGLSTVRSAGQKTRNSAGAAGAGVRNEVGAAVHGIHDGIDRIRQHSEHPAAHKQKRSARKARQADLMGTAAGALASFFVSKLVRTMIRRHGE